MFISAKVWKLAGLLLVMVFAFSAANLVHAVGVTHTITVGTSPTGVAYDSSKGELFVANSGYNTLSVISDSTNAVVKTITVARRPLIHVGPERVVHQIRVHVKRRHSYIRWDGISLAIQTVPHCERPRRNKRHAGGRHRQRKPRVAAVHRTAQVAHAHPVVAGVAGLDIGKLEGAAGRAGDASAVAKVRAIL